MARRATLDRGMPRDRRGRRRRGGDRSPRRGRAGWRSAPQRPGRSSWQHSDRRRRSGAKPWRGSGGRWVVWVLRVIAWAVLLVIGYRGVPRSSRAPGERQRHRDRPATRPGSRATGRGLRPPVRQRLPELQPGHGDRPGRPAGRHAARGRGSAAGLERRRNRDLQSEQVASIQVQGPHSAIVTLLAEVNDSQVIELGVPVYASGGRLVVSGEPALLPVPRPRRRRPRPARASTRPP